MLMTILSAWAFCGILSALFMSRLFTTIRTKEAQRRHHHEELR